MDESSIFGAQQPHAGVGIVERENGPRGKRVRSRCGRQIEIRRGGEHAQATRQTVAQNPPERRLFVCGRCVSPVGENDIDVGNARGAGHPY